MDITQSVQQLLTRETVFADLFYARFLDDYPDVQQFFENIDLKAQGTLLLMALLVMEQHHHHKYFATDQYLRLLGRRHAARKIPLNLIPQFGKCLLQTLERFHAGDWNEQLAAQWRTAIDEAVELLQSGYDDDWLPR